MASPPYNWKDKTGNTLILVKVKPGTKKSSILGVVEIESHYPVNSALLVSLSEQPRENRANIELVDIISKYFKIKKSHIEVIHGHKAKIKVLKLGLIDNILTDIT